MRLLCPVVVLTLAAALLAAGQETGAPSAADFDTQIARLTPKASNEDRLQVAMWFRSNFASEHAKRAVPALEQLIRKDPDAKVREEAVISLSQIARRRKQPCPLALVEATRDREEQVRWHAVAMAGLFKKDFEPGAVDVLVQGTRDEPYDIRSACLFLLAHAGGKDAKALAAIDAAKKDKEFDVRHSAHCARFHATGDLTEFLAYIIRVREEPDAVLNRLPAESEAAKVQQCQRNLFLIGSALSVARWAEARPEDLAAALLKFLSDKSPATRRGAADLIGASARRIEKPVFDPTTGPLVGQDPLQSLLPYIDPEGVLPKERAADGPAPRKVFLTPDAAEPEPKKVSLSSPPPPHPSNVAVRLRELKVEDRLKELRGKDPDETVRKAAARALERLAEVAERIPVRPREVKP
jgi:HEAT repeat